MAPVGSTQDSRAFRALSLWQPHAAAIALGLKPYETRHWSTDYRGPLVIHAAKRPWLSRYVYSNVTAAWNNQAMRRLFEAGTVAGARVEYGLALCLVDLVDCVPAELVPPGDHLFWGDFTPGRFAFKLENVRRINPELPAVGRQKFFTIDIPDSNDALSGTVQSSRDASQSRPNIASAPA